MDASFLKLKQAIIANDVNSFDATASSIVDNAQLSNCTGCGTIKDCKYQFIGFSQKDGF